MITIEGTIKKRSKELQPKMKQRKTIQGAIEEKHMMVSQYLKNKDKSCP